MATAKKKAPIKRRVTSKSTPKKKSTSRANKISVAQKTKSKPTKKARKKATRVKKETNQTSRKLKVKNVDNKASKVKISDNSKQAVSQTEKKILVPSEFKFVKKTRFKASFPEDYLLHQIARYSGVLAVIIGGFFTLVNLQAIVFLQNEQPLIQSATVIEGDLNNTTQTTQDPRPEPRLTLDSGNNLHDVAHILIIVPYAEKVDVLVKSLSSGQLITLGSANRVDNSTWKFDWDTRKSLDGEYKIKLVIKNNYGSYDYTDPNIFVIQNAVESATQDEEDTPDTTNAAASTEETDTNSDSSLETSTTETQTENTDEPSTDEVEEPTVTLELSSGQVIKKDFRLAVSVENATQVKLYAKNTKTLNLHFLGYAVKKSENDWQFLWNSTSVVNGEYSLYAQVSVNGTTIKSQAVRTSVSNEIVTNIPSTTPDESESLDPTTNSDVILKPEIAIAVSKSNPVSQNVTITAKTSPVNWVEIFAIQKNSLILKFLGLAQRESTTSWKYNWDTTQVPNGEYEIYTRVKTDFGFTEGSRLKVVVKNELAYELTDSQEKEIDAFTQVERDLIKVISDTDDNEANTEEDEEQETQTIKYIGTPETFVKTIDTDEETQQKIQIELDGYRERLNELLNDLARATRLNDEKLLEETRAQMLKLKNEIILKFSSSQEKKQITDQISAYISQITFELEEVTLLNETILKERVGEKLYQDSDNDSISDYDEIHLYKTNPYVADTDGDGFVDGAEIESGFNPNDDDSEAFIAYESPKETGIVQEELFSIDTITTLHDETLNDKTIQKKALITGKALPNSFVTIYIFSTPIIVTVRTDADGGWQYIFDKELDDGEHEVYVGITDNAGKIVGKSNPLTFVKTAEAYTVQAQEEVVVTQATTDTTLISGRTLLLIASLAVVSLGLVLILLGLHVTGRKKLEVVETV